jgi:hypothetical protein
MKYYTSKILTLMPLTEQSRSTNLTTLIQMAKASQLGITPKKWESARWDVTEKFISKVRPGKGRKKIYLLFTRDPKSSDSSEAPFRNQYDDLIKTFVVLRHEIRPKTHGSHQHFINAFRHLYESIPPDQNEIRLITPTHFDMACASIISRYQPTTAKKMISKIIEIADLLDANNLVSCRLDYRCRLNIHVSETEDISKQRFDMPETLGKTEDKRVAVEILAAIGQLYKAIPISNAGDAILIRLIMLMAVLGRRIGEILSLPQQQLNFDQNNRPYLIYYPQKRSVGVLQIFVERLWVIPQTAKLIESLLADIQVLTTNARLIAKQVETTNSPDLSGLPQNEWISAKELSDWLNVKPGSARLWALKRNICYRKNKRQNLYQRKNIESALKPEAITGPVLTTSSTPRFLYVSDMLFIAQPSTFHRSKAPKPYAAVVITEGQVRDFLSNRRNLNCAFERYGVLKNFECYRSNPHSFRHFLNDMLDQAGMPLLAQTAWFGRTDPRQTTVYHGTSSAEIVLKAQVYAATFAEGTTTKVVPLPPVSFKHIKQLGQQRPIHDLGDGACIHHPRQSPCPNAIGAPASPTEFYWITNQNDLIAETTRQVHLNEGLLDLALERARKDPFATAWADHYKARLNLLKQQPKS